MRTLLTFTGFHDPYSRGLIGEQEQTGPILSLVEARPFDRVILFSTPRMQKQTDATEQALRALQPRLVVEVREIELDDPTDYLAILRGLRRHAREIVDGEARGTRPEYFIAVASGTPQMHACWLLLAACGEIPARILNVRPPQFVTRERSLVWEVDLTSPELPQVRAGTEFPPDRPAVHEPGPGGFESPARALQELGLVADHPAMRKAVETAVNLASGSTAILILGETGTGKELLARLVHRLSGRTAERFVAVNCSAIPENLVESSLFGHARGAFTGAHRDQHGKFMLANGGTLFLDEIGELPLAAQAKLLRALQDGLIEPVGAEKSCKVDVRLIAATNRDLRREKEEGRFREDLYYRVAVGVINLPPLRERPSDIPKIALHVLDHLNGTLRRPRRLATGALQRLQAHTWPGNVRDLMNVLERSAQLCPRDVLEADDLIIDEPSTRRDPLAGLPAPHEGFSLDEFLSAARRQLFLRALETADGNQSAAARLLDVSPQAVHKFVKEDVQRT
jgi:DNA-binding NtrC family response regulator